MGVFIFTFFSFLIWLYLASNHSTPDDWWTVKYVKETYTVDNEVKMIPHHFSTSLLKVIIGTGIFILLGTLLSFFVINRKQRRLD
ncbi:hypothetical protein [Sutcliffiella horikoshii]|uniref:Uncharacterized protein n=1 Tax=Sutcliffiella horikoshii TaxID=79883 RepID=A0A5D4TG98_9BACI|nr:hypothetical protein [Sutcliffiella horikoshii]TYS73156.1 hypothetical protein FZC75_08905 [Sutcliffiella horikoshii]